MWTIPSPSGRTKVRTNQAAIRTRAASSSTSGPLSVDGVRCCRYNNGVGREERAQLLSQQVRLWAHILRQMPCPDGEGRSQGDRKSTRLNSSHSQISYAVFCLKKKKK